MNTLAYLNELGLSGLDDIRTLKQEFYKKKITVGYEPNATEGKRRVILTCSKTLRNYTFDSINRECNGLILEASSSGWRVLVAPVQSPKSKVNTNKINKWLNEELYEVYAMEDGTIINLYFYNDKWVISTARGIDMNDVKFNTLTYQQMLDECLVHSNASDLYTSLDKSRCYTLGFKHPDIHPFQEGRDEQKEPIYKIWSIQSVVLADDYIPDRTPFAATIRPQKKYTFKTKNMHNLYKRLSAALSDYIAGKRPNYGYILVSKRPEITQEFTVIMLESSLMRMIRKLWYDSEYIQFSEAKKYKKLDLILLNSFLDDTRTNIFTTLFPAYTETFRRLETLENELIGLVHSAIRNEEVEVGSFDIEAVKALATEVKNIITVDQHDNPRQKIKEVIHTNKYIDIYYAAYIN